MYMIYSEQTRVIFMFNTSNIYQFLILWTFEILFPSYVEIYNQSPLAIVIQVISVFVSHLLFPLPACTLFNLQKPQLYNSTSSSFTDVIFVFFCLMYFMCHNILRLTHVVTDLNQFCPTLNDRSLTIPFSHFLY